MLNSFKVIIDFTKSINLTQLYNIITFSKLFYFDLLEKS